MLMNKNNKSIKALLITSMLFTSVVADAGKGNDKSKGKPKPTIVRTPKKPEDTSSGAAGGGGRTPADGANAGQAAPAGEQPAQQQHAGGGGAEGEGQQQPAAPVNPAQAVGENDEAEGQPAAPINPAQAVGENDEAEGQPAAPVNPAQAVGENDEAEGQPAAPVNPVQAVGENVEDEGQPAAPVNPVQAVGENVEDEGQPAAEGEQAAQQQPAEGPQQQQRRNRQNVRQRSATPLERQMQDEDDLQQEQTAAIDEAVKKRTDKLSRVANSQKENSRLSSDIADSVFKAEEDRIDDLSNLIAVPAGGNEHEISYGVWTKAVFSKGNQKKDKNVEPFKSNQRGFVIGADALVTEDLLLGAIYSHSLLNKNFKEGNYFDKKKVRGNTLALYSTYNITKNVIINGQVQYGFLNINGTRHEDDETGNHELKTNGRQLGAKLSTSYSHVFENGYMLRPKLGIAYSRTRINPYQEQGLDDNISSAKTTSDRVTTTAGLAFGKKFYSRDMVYIPMIYTNAEYAIKDKTNRPKIHANNNEEIGVLEDSGAGRAAFTFGAKLSAHHNNGIEASLNYEHTRRAKYSSHLGSIKLKVNF